MLKKKNLIKSAILLIMTFFLLTCIPMNKSYASDPITGNNSFETAYNFGYWKYKYGTAILPAGENEAYFSFTADSGERIMAQSTYRDEYWGMEITIYDEAGQLIDTRNNPVKPGYVPFIYAKCDPIKIRQKFYVKVTRGNYEGDMYFTVSFEDRIRTGHKTFNFPGTATNPGNKNYDPNGVDSNVLTLDLRNDTSIPNKAIVRSVTTSARQTPSQGNVHHWIMCSQTEHWYESKVSSSSSGHYYITVEDNLKVANVWNFKYNAKATAPSKMTNVKMDVEYEYDITDTYVPY
ncbi:hypothetical protein [Tepidimicrobium xylanilyticum]|uniref:Uncharacterized protein n=1 Tax=Tepidimicrobium xylanilyticum TaxID=1123352 RepID=A0A1H3D5G4_9FIRM|nr:hypothetical protein [Tepidimicrobium xylanilyticum]SDX61651.1 hypothetical protein SAMN05660923_02609 [Tepidimicrobium xylanilyticum]